MDSFTKERKDVSPERDAFSRVKRAEVIRASIVSGVNRKRFGR